MKFLKLLFFSSNICTRRTPLKDNFKSFTELKYIVFYFTLIVLLLITRFKMNKKEYGMDRWWKWWRLKKLFSECFFVTVQIFKRGHLTLDNNPVIRSHRVTTTFYFICFHFIDPSSRFWTTLAAQLCVSFLIINFFSTGDGSYWPIMWRTISVTSKKWPNVYESCPINRPIWSHSVQ